jgi:hypothetical protein
LLVSLVQKWYEAEFGELAMSQTRKKLTPETFAESIKTARAGTDGVLDYVDEELPYLILRVRGHSMSWLVKTRDRTKKIGTPLAADATIPGRARQRASAATETLSLRAARKIAKREWAAMDGSPAPAAKPETWSWGKLDEEYQAYVSNFRENASGNIKHPSRETVSDVRQAFAHAPIAAWSRILLVDLNEDLFDDALKTIHRTQSWDAHRKARAYVQAALAWAAKYHGKESGLRGRHWWKLVPQRQRTPKETVKRAERQEALKTVKDNFKVKDLGELLNVHEKFCLARTGNERVSPGVRWGFWWDALTAHRRGSGTWVALADIQWQDLRNERPGWGLATWRPDVMKTQNEFVLPLPPLGLHILRCAIRDNQEALKRGKREKHTSKWVFPSRVIQSAAGDLAVSGSALATHLRSMRGQCPDRKDPGPNYLKDIPHFSMHIIRSTMGDYLADDTELPPGTASLMINHALPGDEAAELGKLARTTRRYYVRAQRIPQKIEAMALWSDALLQAFKDAGGLYPA